MESHHTAAIKPSDLPPDLRPRGRPLSVHRPWKAVFAEAEARLVGRLFGDRGNPFRIAPGLKSALAFGGAALAFLAAAALTWIYFYKPPQNEDPVFVLIAAGIVLLFAIVLLAAGLIERFKRDPPPEETPRPVSPGAVPDLYLVYPDGLASVKDGKSQFLAWSEVKEVAQVRSGMQRQTVVRAADGREIVVWDGFTEPGELRLAIEQQVSRCLLPRVLQRIEEGKSVKFGAITLSPGGLKYKDQKAPWSEITSMKIIAHGGDVRFTVRTRGRLLRWCWCDVNNIANWNTFYDALCRTAPENLLQKSNKPRW